MMPRAALDVVRAAADDLLQARSGGKLSFGLLVSLWLASACMEAVIEGLNMAFQIKEARPWWRRRLVAIGLTVSVALLTGCAFGLALAGGVGGRLLAGILNPGEFWSPLGRAAQWVAILLFAVAVVYFLGPNWRGAAGWGGDQFRHSGAAGSYPAVTIRHT